MSTGLPAGHGTSRGRFRVIVVLLSVAAAAVGAVLLATRDSGEDATTRGVTATLRVPGHPGSLAVGPKALWFTLADARPPIRDRPLLRLDLASGSIQRRILMGGQTSYMMRVGNRLLASVEHVGGEGSGPSLVVALDWRSGRLLLRRQFPGPVGPLAAYGDGLDLWALQVRPGTLLRLDPRSLAPTAPPLRLSTGRTLGLAVGLGYVWATAADTGEVLRIDPVRRTIERVHVGGFPLGIVVAGGSTWYADRERGEVVRLEPQTLRTVGKPIHVGSDLAWMGSAGRYLLVGDTDSGTVTRIDVRSGKKAGLPIRIAQPATDAPDFAVVPAGRSIWISSFASNTLTRISATPSAASAPPAVTASSIQATSTVGRSLPRGGRVVARIPVPPGGGAFTAGEGAVWAESDIDSALLRIDPKRNAVVARITVAPAESAAAGEGGVWLSHPGSDTVSRIDPNTNKVTATIPVGPQPAGVAVSEGAVWVANAGGPSVSRIDPATNRVVATIRVGPKLACCAEHMETIAGGGAVWVAVPNGNRIVRVDPETSKVVASIKLPYPPCAFLAADQTAVWSSGGGCSDTLARIDPRTRRLTARVGEPHPVGVRLAFGSVWVAVLGSKNVDRIDPSTGRIVARLRVGGTPVRLADGFGAVWVSDDDGRILRIEPQS